MVKTILLAEDDPYIRDIYATVLKKTGYKILIANDGQMAFEKIKNHYPDMVLLDIGLPKMNGWEVLKMVRANKATKNVKVMVMSNNDPSEYPGDLGVLKYFLKVETTPDEVIEKIEEILS